MTSSHRQIENANSIVEVVAMVRDFLATWSPRDLMRLPLSVRPGRIRDEEDVAALHAQLIDEYRVTRATGDEMSALQQLTSLLVCASNRIAELRERNVTGGSSVAASNPVKSAAGRRR
jgi:hypothetical protein